MNGPATAGAGNDASDGLLLDPVWAVAGTAMAGLVVAVLLWRNRADASTTTTTVDDELIASDIDGPSESDSMTTGTPALDATADTPDTSRPNDAVATAYVGARQSLGPVTGVDDVVTRWGFCDRCVNAGAAPIDTFESSTADYERTAYSGLSVSDEAVAELVEMACSLTGTAAPDAMGSSNFDGDTDASEVVGTVEQRARGAAGDE